MPENNYQKFVDFLKKVLYKLRPRFSFHYVAYTTLFALIIFSVIQLAQATTPNPGHPWSEVGDGVFVVSGLGATSRTFTFPDANATVLTTNSAVTVAQGGTGLTSIAAGSVLVANSANTLSAETSTVGTKVLTNTSGTITWGTAPSSMVYPGAGIPVSTGSSWSTSITDNSANWNTAYGWGNHGSAGYLTSATASSTYVPYTGGTSNVDLGIYNLTVDTNSLFVDATNHRVGIGTITPGYKLDVLGTNAYPVQIKGSTGGGLILGEYNNEWGGFWAASVTPSVTNWALISSFRGTAINAPSTTPLTFSINASEKMRVDSGGNVGIGTIAPTGKIDVQGLAIHDLPTYSAEFLLSTGWTSIDWTGDFATGWTHTTGNVTVLAQSKLAVSATKYQIAYTVTGRTTGSFTIRFGGQTSSAITATGAWGPTTTSTASLTITPTTDFNGTIVISIKSLTAVSTPLVNLKSSDGTARIEMRANTATGNTFIGVGAGRYNTTGTYNTANGLNSLNSNTTGSYNTANGLNSLNSNTTGSNNTANGYNSLNSNTTGSNNTANGYNSLNSNTTGYNNTANGYYSLFSNTTGTNNTANGNASLSSNTTGSSNTANGVNSLSSNTTGSNNTANGYNSLNSNTTGTNNTANGNASLSSNTTGSSNTANGNYSLYNNTTGSNNTANGMYSLYANITGYNNTANGYNSLSSNTTGSSNTANGNASLSSNTTGSYNTANGLNSLNSNTTGSNNTANGNYSLYSNTTGNQNIANGNYSLYSNTTGNSNTANGMYSLNSNTTGYNNTANGYNSLNSNTTGYYNTANGLNSLNSNTTGSNNTANGYNSLYSNTTGNSNIANGLNSGRYIADGTTANTTSDYSVYLGNDTKAGADNNQNEIVIGYNAIGGGSNTATIGNTSLVRTYLTGVNLKAGSATAGTAPLKFATGTLLTTPEAGAMEYDGTNLYFTPTGTTRKTFAYTSDLTSGYIPYTGGTTNVDLGIHNLTVDTNSLFVDSVNHRVGIGTTAPGATLDVNGDSKFGGITATRYTSISSQGIITTRLDNNTSGAQNLINIQNLHTTTGFTHQTGILWQFGRTDDITARSAGQLIVGKEQEWTSTAATNNSFMSFYTGLNSNLTEKMRINSSGNVGIGTTAPTSILALGGTAARTIQMERNTTATTAGQGLTLSSGGAIAGTADLAGGDLNLKSGISTGTGTSALRFFTATAGTTGTTDNTQTEKMTILGSGNVGIGTTAPSSKLHISGTVGLPSSALLTNTTDSSEFIFYPGDVGTGFGVTSGKNMYFGTFTSPSSLSGWSEKFRIESGGNVGIGVGPSARLTVKSSGATSSTSAVSVVNSADTSLFYVRDDGNVGIGTSTPQGQFHLYGSVYEDNVPAMITDSNPSPLVTSASSTYGSTYLPYMAFNKVSGQYGWIALSGTLTGWLKQDLGATGAKTITAYSVTAVYNLGNYITAVPKNWTFEGSNNDSTWTVLDTQTNITSWAYNELKQFTIASPASYRYYRLNISANNGHGTYLMVSQLRLLESVSRTKLLVDNQSTFITRGITGQLSKLQSWQNVSGIETASMTATGILTTASLVTGAITATSASSFTSSITDTMALTTTPTDGFIATSTASLVGTPVRISPSFTWVGNAWNTTATAVNKANAIQAYLIPVTGSTTSGSLVFANKTVDGVANSTEIMRLTTSGMIGIGTTAPTNILSLSGTSARTIWMERNTTAATAGLGLTLSSGGAIAGTADLAGGDLNLKSGISTGTGTSALRFFTATAGSTGTTDNTPTEKMTILGNGNVGIGFLTPKSTVPSGFNNVAQDRVLEIRSESNAGDAGIFIRRFDGLTGLDLWTEAAGNGPAYIDSLFNSDVGGLRFRVKTQGTPVNAMTILGSGYIGIGTTSPTYKLDVKGTAVANGIRSDMGFDIYQVPDPTAPTGVVSSGGSVDTGDHWYGVTYTTATGETHITYSATQITTTAGNNTVTLTIPVSTDPRVTGRKIYRTKVGTSNWTEYLLVTIPNNTSTAYVDSAADSTLSGSSGLVYFKANTTSNNISMNGSRVLTSDKNLTAVGYNAGASLTTGGRATLYGSSAGSALTTATDSSLFGYQAGVIITSGGQNTLMGSYAGAYITTSSSNTLMGYQAGYTGTGSGVTAIGRYTLRNVTTGNYNVALGMDAGTYLTGGSTQVTSISNSVFLGASSRAANATGDTNEIVIGYGAIGNGSNTATWGSTSILTHYFSGDIMINSADLGDGLAGKVITLGRNTNATNTGAGSINFLSKADTAGFVWQDAAGNMRINTSAPSNADDTAGTVIGAQTSMRETKQDIEDYIDYSSALLMVTNAPLHKFRYIKEVEGYGTDSPLAKSRIGFIADEVDPAFMVGNVIDQVSVNGILMASIKEMDLKLVDINNFEDENTWRDSLISWFSNASNHITRIFTGEVCLTEAGQEAVCLNRAELQSLKNLLNNQTNTNGSSSSNTNTNTNTNTDTTNTDNSQVENNPIEDPVVVPEPEIQIEVPIENVPEVIITPEAPVAPTETNTNTEPAI